MNETVPSLVPSESAEPPPPAPIDSRHNAAAIAGHVRETTQTVLTGLVLAFIFRAFVVEPFIIPSGSMAPSLLGPHVTRACPACGWEVDVGTAQDAPSGLAVESICPNCLYRWTPPANETVPRAGDRILVHKWPFALGGLLGPQRWDVIVFRDPANPDQHFIKRLVGLPGESVEIIDGDVFINGEIARKTPQAQESLWFPVFDQSHLPCATGPVEPPARWMAIDRPPADGSGWSGMGARIIRYDGLDDTPRRLAFSADAGREYLTDFAAYNGRSSGALARDVRIVAEVTFRAGDGWCQWHIRREPYRFVGEMRRDGQTLLRVERTDEPETAIATHAAAGAPWPLDRPIRVELGHVDYRAYLRVEGRDVLETTDAEYGPPGDVRRPGDTRRLVGVTVAAEGLRLELRGLRVDRDVYYTQSSGCPGRAAPGNPFVLRRDEYFVLGDNSAASKDSREWTEVGPHLPPGYRPGTVLADQIVGQAAFVYLPGLLPLDRHGGLRVPDLGRVRFVR